MPTRAGSAGLMTAIQMMFCCELQELTEMLQYFEVTERFKVVNQLVGAQHVLNCPAAARSAQSPYWRQFRMIYSHCFYHWGSCPQEN